MFTQQGGRGVAKIGIFTTASADPTGAADYYVDMFVRVYGAASATFIPVTETSNNANSQSMPNHHLRDTILVFYDNTLFIHSFRVAIVDMVQQQTGFFFGGGDQLRIIQALRPNGVDSLTLNAIKEVLRRGGVVGGTSAGTACQVHNNL